MAVVFVVAVANSVAGPFTDAVVVEKVPLLLSLFSQLGKPCAKAH